MDTTTDTAASRQIPETARVVNSYLDRTSDICVYTLCLGNGLHAEYDNYAADVYKRGGLDPAANVKISACDCAEKRFAEVPEIVKARLRQYYEKRR